MRIRRRHSVPASRIAYHITHLHCAHHHLYNHLVGSAKYGKCARDRAMMHIITIAVLDGIAQVEAREM